MVLTILHTSDNHLDVPAVMFGSNRYKRKEDFLQTFDTMVRYALESRPDLLLHSGDLFDGLNPRNPVRAQVMTAFRRIHENGTRIFVISGNHDVPRGTGQGVSPLLEYAKAGFVTFFNDWETIGSESVDVRGLNVEVSGISFDPTMDARTDPLGQVSIPGKGDVNILLVHQNIEGLRGTFPTTPTIRLASIDKKLTYLAVGHIHQYQKQQVGNTMICAPGSTEHVSFAEEKQQKGFVWLELDTDGVHQLKFISVNTRPMQTLDFSIPVDADINELLIKEINRLRNPQLILRFHLKGVMTIKSAERYRRSEVLRHGFAKCFSAEIVDELEYINPEPPLSGEAQLKPPLTEYRDLLSAYIQREKDAAKQALLQKALERGLALLEEEGGW
jgi:DNA repair exonuclease SbcCD nuclease subunit